MLKTYGWCFVATILLALPLSTVLARGGGGGRVGGGMGGGAPHANLGGGGNFGGGGGMAGGGAHPNFSGGNLGGGNFSGGGAGRTNIGGGGNFSGGNIGGGASAFGGGNFSGASGLHTGDNRANFGGGNAGGFNQADRTNLGNGAGNAGLEGRNAFQSSEAYNHPQQNQLNNFLNLPASSGAGDARAKTNNLGANNSGSKSYTTPGGATITAGKGSGSFTTPGGTTIGGAGAGIKVEGANGQTFVKGTGVAGATNGTNSAIRGGSATGFENAAGDKAVNVRGGSANSSGYRQAGSVTAVQGKNGYTAVNARGVAGANGTGVARSATAVRGPDGNTIVAGRGASFVNGQFVGGQSWSAVNGSYRHWNYYTPNWYGRYPGCWYPNAWAVGLTAWAIADWTTASSYCGVQTAPTYYDYDNSVTYNEDGNVYFGDQPVATTEQYYTQASQIAAAGETTENEEWMPLGVFALLGKDDQTKTDKTIQLALNKAGVIRGNLEDSLSNTVTPVSGSVDKETQRVAFTVKGNERAVIETGLYNLTNDEVPVLVHLGADQVQKHLMIRLQQPAEEGK